jgi:hypothetical protein
MNKICTSIEQSLKLIELGIDVNTADMYYYDKNIFSGAMSAFNGVLLIRGDKFPDNTTPAWSLSALLKLMPYRTEASKRESYGKIMKRDTWDGEFCFICYPKGLEKNKHLSGYHNNPVDAAFEIICWLLENKRL